MPTPAPVISPPSTSFDPFAPPPMSSFAAIQSEQIAQVEAVKDHKAPRSFAEVMAQEQADARRREEEDKEAKEFAKWFEEESKRVQAEESALRSAVASGSGGSKGKKGARGGATSGTRGKGAKKNAGGGNGENAQPSDVSTPPKAKRSSRGGGSSGRGGGNAGGGGGSSKGKGKVGGPESVPFTPGVQV